MIERLLKSWTRVPLIVERNFPLIADSRIGVSPATGCADAAPAGAPTTQHRGCDVEGDVWTVTPKQFLFHAIGSTARTVPRLVTRTWRIQATVHELGTNAVSLCRCQDSAARQRKIPKLKIAKSVVERILCGSSEPLRERPNLLLAHNRSARDLQPIWRCPRLASITAATRRPVWKSPTFCCPSRNERTETKAAFRRLRGRQRIKSSPRLRSARGGAR